MSSFNQDITDNNYLISLFEVSLNLDLIFVAALNVISFTFKTNLHL